jgi:ectoine hydroxylase-related dioxygenase (phytanoyl-CoA dioxygenase family)
MAILTHNKPELTTLPADSPLEKIVETIKRDGACILKDLIPLGTLSNVKAEARASLDADVATDGSFFPPETRRTYSLIQSSRTFSNDILMNKTILAVAGSFVTSRHSYWSGEKRTAVSPPQVSATGALVLGPGAKAQDFHRDDHCWHVNHSAVDEYEEGRDVQLSVLVAGSRATKENGATRVIPGSHLWNDDREPKWEDGVAFAEMEPGSAMFFLGSVYHAGGENVTEDEYRHLYAAAYLRAYLRQEENQYLAVQPEVARELAFEIQDIMGYSVSAPFCGWVKFDSPSKLLRGGELRPRDFY